MWRPVKWLWVWMLYLEECYLSWKGAGLEKVTQTTADSPSSPSESWLSARVPYEPKQQTPTATLWIFCHNRGIEPLSWAVALVLVRQREKIMMPNSGSKKKDNLSRMDRHKEDLPKVGVQLTCIFTIIKQNGHFAMFKKAWNQCFCRWFNCLLSSREKTARSPSVPSSYYTVFRVVLSISYFLYSKFDFPGVGTTQLREKLFRTMTGDDWFWERQCNWWLILGRQCVPVNGMCVTDADADCGTVVPLYGSTELKTSTTKKSVNNALCISVRTSLQHFNEVVQCKNTVWMPNRRGRRSFKKGFCSSYRLSTKCIGTIRIISAMYQ